MTFSERAARRVEAAADLEAAIAAVGIAYAAYTRATGALEDRVGHDLARYLEVPIISIWRVRGWRGSFSGRIIGRPVTPAWIDVFERSKHEYSLLAEHLLTVACCAVTRNETLSTPQPFSVRENFHEAIAERLLPLCPEHTQRPCEQFGRPKPVAHF